ncbi:unnamed protein product [Notodromas monacha]|uniref:ribonuclease H n=1 Tax=Notodromas monacha TaxID=399045 RepID=A0A7R9GI31_9CRUS|nr:unnamed protein product [Notodromas monacha]CAG0922157.1 unnamed protein product [Notodromas monacha]
MVMIPQRVMDGARRAYLSSSGFLYMDDGYAYCFVDGSCMDPVRNAGVGVWFGQDHLANVSEPLQVPGTNNRAELLALLYAIHAAYGCGLQMIEIRSDSKYAINCVRVWMKKWKKNGWRTATNSPVENQAEIRAIDEAHSLLHVRYDWVPGHSGDPGNDAADRLAKAGAAQSLANYRQECEPQVSRFSRNEYRKFDTRQDAENYLNEQGSQVTVNNRILMELLRIVKDLVRKVHSLESSHEAVRGVPQCPCPPTCSGNAEKRRADTDIISVEPPSKIFRPDLVVREPESVVPSAVRATYEKPTIPPKILEQARKAKVSDFAFTPDGFAICYTDGSCNSSLKTSGVGVWFGPDHVANISEPLSVPGTFNRAELTAVLYAIHVAKEAGLSKLEVRTDSLYAKNCAAVWLPKWKQNNWQTTANKDVLNQKEIRAIDEAFNHVEVKFKLIRAFSGEEGREGADRLSRLGADESLRISKS